MTTRICPICSAFVHAPVCPTCEFAAMGEDESLSEYGLRLEQHRAPGADAVAKQVPAVIEPRSLSPSNAEVDEQRALLRDEPFRVESYHALWESYLRRGDHDAAWCIASALCLLQKDAGDQRQYYEEGLRLTDQAGFPRQPLQPSHWESLIHPLQDMLVTLVFAVLVPGLRHWYTVDLRTWGVRRRKDVLDPEIASEFYELYRASAEFVGLEEAPIVYWLNREPFGMRYANTDPPAFIVGDDMISDTVFSRRALAFLISKQMSAAQPHTSLALSGYPAEFIQTMLDAAIHVVVPEMAGDEEVGEPQKSLIREISRLPKPLLSQLQKVLRKLVELNEDPDIEMWLRGVDHTSSRLALLFARDLTAAARSLKLDVHPVGDAPVAERVGELVKFAISEEYFTLRRALGLTISPRS